jgi:hypothetical protein
VFSNSLLDKELHNLRFGEEHRKFSGIDFFDNLLDVNNQVYYMGSSIVMVNNGVKKKLIGGFRVSMNCPIWLG